MLCWILLHNWGAARMRKGKLRRQCTASASWATATPVTKQYSTVNLNLLEMIKGDCKWDNNFIGVHICTTHRWVHCKRMQFIRRKVCLDNVSSLKKSAEHNRAHLLPQHSVRRSRSIAKTSWVAYGIPEQSGLCRETLVSTNKQTDRQTHILPIQAFQEF